MDQEVRAENHAYLGGTVKRMDCLPIQIGGVADHVHLLTTLFRTVPISEFVKECKRGSSNWMKGRLNPRFYWQSFYATFSVNSLDAESLVRYVMNQEIHDREVGFKEEYRDLLRRHGIEFDEKYVWD